MENKKKGSKALLIGVIGAVVVLALVLGLVLTQCTGGQTEATTVPTTVGGEEIPSYKLYWNLDRAEYDGQSEAGMSSRQMESDGYFHVRLFCDGEELVLKTADRKIINKLDTMSLMGLELDENGLIVAVNDVRDLPLSTEGWGFYVQSVGGKALKLNSSDSFAGMELLLDMADAKVYDMTGMSGPVGSVAEPMTNDRVYPVHNKAGVLTHVFLYDRTNFMLTNEAECQHCKETVQWSEWTRGDAFPTKSGHYKLMTDVQMPGQISFASDVKICLDLNGHTVNGKDNARMVSLHNPGTSFALMDTSEAKTGKMVGHSTASPQGGIVWVRYGQFHMYGGTLDGSDMVSRLNGTVVQVPKNAFFYLYDGEIIGGTAAPQYNAETKKYTYGLGGALQVAGTFRMYGGTIRDGKAPAAYYKNAKGVLTLSRGMGGNIFLSSGAVMEMTGGEILNGKAGNVGGNIMMDGTAQLIITGGKIEGGKLDGRIAAKHGANIYVPSKGSVDMSGGMISFGRAPSGGGGNIYLAGSMKLSGGAIAGGWAGTTGGNILMSGAAQLYMSGGEIYCGKANGQTGGYGGGNISLVGDKSKLTLVGGVIRDGEAIGLVNEDGTTVGGVGGNINLNRGSLTLRGGAILGGKATGDGGGIYIGWNSVGMKLSQKTRIYNNEVTDIVRSNNTAKGKSQFLLGAWEGNGDKPNPVVDRVSGVAGSLVISPREETTFTEEDVAKFTSGKSVLPLELNANGNIVFAKPYLGEPDHTHCLCAGNVSHTCSDTGFVSVTADVFNQCWSAGSTADNLMGSLNMCLAEDVTISTEHTMSGNTLNLCLHGHTITMEGDARLTANGVSGKLNITDCTGRGKIVAAEGCRASFLFSYKGEINLYNGTVDASRMGAGYGAIRVGYAGDVVNMYGGTVIGSKRASAGGSVYLSADGTFNLYGGTIRDGVASGGGGGNIFMSVDGAVVNIYGGTIRGGQATATKKGSGLGGNIHVVRGTLNMYGGKITDGTAKGLTDDGEPAGVTGGVYLAYRAKPFTLSGNARIYGNTGSDIWLTSLASYVVNLDGWNGNGSSGELVIGKTGAAAGSLLVGGDASKADVDLFRSGVDGLVIKYKSGKLILATPFVHEHCICAGKVEGHTCTTTSFVEVANAEDFKSLFSSKNELNESVDVALTGSFTLDAEYKTAGKTLNLCLNGHTITMKSNGRLTANGDGELNITDCGSGKIVAAAGCRHSFLYAYNGSLNLYAGVIDGSAIVLDKTATNKSGGVVCVYNAGDTFHMYGGEIIGATIYRGGAIYVYKGAFHLHDGKISGGNAKVGGNIAVDFGDITLSGGEITGGSAETNGAAVFHGYNSKTAMVLSGDVKIYGNTGDNDIWMGQKPDYKVNHLVIDGWEGNGTHGAICVDRNTGATDTVVAVAKTGELDKAMLKNFTQPNEELQLILSEGKIVLAPYHKHCVCAGKVEGHSCTDVKFVNIATAAEFADLFEENKLKGSVSIVLTDSFTLDAEYVTNGHVLTICLNGNTITMAGSGRITANGASGVLNIADCGSGKIEAAEGAATSFLYTYKGKLNIYAGTVDATKTAAAAGGAIRVSQPGDELNIYGGTVIGSQKGTTGGSIYVTNTGTVNIYGGTVKNGVATSNGGNISLAKGTLNVFGGTITGGKGVNGGNIQANADDVVINISGGTISNGTATGVGNATGLGGNIHMVRGTLNISGGTVTGGTAMGATDENNPVGATGGIYLAYNAKAFTLSGNARIYGNNGADVWLTSKASYVITVDGWTGNGSNDSLVVGKNNAANGTLIASGKTALTEADLAKFKSAYEDLKLALDGGNIILEEVLYHEHCLCNGKYTGHTCSDVRFTEVTGTDDFLALFDADRKLKSSANVYLTGDVELSAEYWTNGYILTICLNGHTIDLKTDGRLTANATTGVLNITDCGSGEIKGATNSFLYGYKGDINLYGGTVNASAIKLSISGGKFGGAVYVSATGDTFTMYGGTILGGQLERGGAVFAQNGSVIIRGGLITGGKAKVGGGVGVNFGTFEMTGGEITGNDASTNGAGVFLGYNMTTKGILGGSAAIYGNTGCEDVRLGQKAADNNRFVLDGWTGCGEGKTMTLSSASGKADAVVAEAKTGTVSESLLAYLDSYDADYTLVLDGDGQVAMKALHRHCVCDGEGKADADHTCQKVTYTEVNAAQFLALFGTDKKLTASHTVVLTEDVTLDAEYTLNGNTLNLCLGGKTITMTGNGRLIVNGVSGVLNLAACDGGKIEAAEGARASFLYTYKGVMNLYGGTVDANKSAAGNGGAILVGYAGDELNIFGGTIIGSQKGTAGGSIYMAVNGTITMYGGTVKDGKATAGGGNLRLEAGEAYIKGGTITGGTAACGGNIHVYKTAKLFVEGGTISDGESNGTKGGYGGGNIYLGDGAGTTGSITISGGTISGGTSGLEGGNINVNRGSMTVTGGTITGGSSDVTGGGIYVGYNGTGVTISGNALIYGNTDTDICRSSNTKTTTGMLLLGDWAGNGEHGAAKVDSLFTATGKTVIAPAGDYTLTEADLAKFECVGTYGLALSGGNFVTAAK